MTQLGRQSDPARPTLVAVDIGNARIKLGRFEGPSPADAGNALPRPDSTRTIDGRAPDFNPLADWLAEMPGAGVAWWIASVNRPATTGLLDWLNDHRPDDAARLLTSSDLPLRVEGPRADMVGVDRLLDAVAVNALRSADRPAVVVDVGTAITVDLVDARGVFGGGAILPGIAMSARAMHEFTDLLPMIDMSELRRPPPAVGRSTEEAMRAGLFWMVVGTIRELAGRMAADEERSPEVFVSGGAGVAVAELLGADARHVPHLTLGGIALAASYQRQHARPEG